MSCNLAQLSVMVRLGNVYVAEQTETSADMVKNTAGNTLQETVGGIKGLTTDMNVASNGYVIDAKVASDAIKNCLVIVSFNPTTKELVTRSYSGV